MENDKHIKFPKILIGVLTLIAVIIVFYFGGSIIETFYNIGRTLGMLSEIYSGNKERKDNKVAQIIWNGNKIWEMFGTVISRGTERLRKKHSRKGSFN